MSANIGTVITYGNTTLGGSSGKLSIKTITCEDTCTMTFESPLGTNFTIGNLVSDSMNNIDFSKNLTNMQQVDILKKILYDNTIALNN